MPRLIWVFAGRTHILFFVMSRLRCSGSALFALTYLSKNLGSLWYMCWTNPFYSANVCAQITEPPHDKTNKMTVRQAKTQISLGICPVWLESSLCTQWVAKGALNGLLRTQAFFMQTAKTLIRLGGSESSLGTHAILLVLSWGGSYNF